MGRVWRLRNVTLASLLAAVALLSIMWSGDTAHATDAPIAFDPTYNVSLSNEGTGEVTDIVEFLLLPAPEAFFTDIPLPVLLTPEDNAGTPGEDGYATPNYAGAAIGANVGRAIAKTTIGQLNGPCLIPAPVPFDPLFNATTDVSTTDNDPSGPKSDAWHGYGDGDAALGTPPGPIGFGGTPDGKPDATTRYPEFLEGLLPQADFGEPIARLYGQVLNFAGIPGTHVSINLMLYPAGALDVSPFNIDATAGYPMVIVVENPDTLVQEVPSVVTDTCSSTEVFITRLGTASDSTTLWTNPTSAGDVDFGLEISGVPDADGDGIDNSDDTCPFDENVGSPFFPFAPGSGDLAGEGFPTGDGIDGACDNPSVKTDGNDAAWSNGSPCRGGGADDGDKLDCDEDDFLNRDDNCPQHSNPTQRDGDSDGIGDTCDLAGAGGIGLGPDVLDGPELAISKVSTATIKPLHDLDLTLSRLSGNTRVKGKLTNQSRGYSLKLFNDGPVAEKALILVAVLPVSGCDRPGIDTDGDSIDDSFTVGSINADPFADSLAIFVSQETSPGKTSGNDFEVLYGDCPPNACPLPAPGGTDCTPTDYAILIDVCHSGDSARLGFFGAACTNVQAPDGGLDFDFTDDAIGVVTVPVNDTEFFLVP